MTFTCRRVFFNCCCYVHLSKVMWTHCPQFGHYIFRRFLGIETIERNGSINKFPSTCFHDCGIRVCAVNFSCGVQGVICLITSLALGLTLPYSVLYIRSADTIPRCSHIWSGSVCVCVHSYIAQYKLIHSQYSRQRCLLPAVCRWHCSQLCALNFNGVFPGLLCLLWDTVFALTQVSSSLLCL